MTRKLALIVLLLSVALILPVPARADCPGPLLNAGFEDGGYKTEGLGTSLSSNLGNGWKPWSILGDATYNREVEYKVLDAAYLGSNYHVRSGNASQKFFTTWGTHTAGFYQRVPVPRGSQVTFSIWVQIYTGEREITSNGHFISDLEQSGEANAGPGKYKVYAGIDPYGGEPAGFGASPSANTVWSNPITDHETRAVLESGEVIDKWVQLTITTIAQSDAVTVYTKGQPEFPVKHNDSFWDDACLTISTPPTTTPKPTSTPTETPLATDTPVATETPTPTETSLPTDTPTVAPTDTPEPTEEPTEMPTDTPEPTVTELPTETAEPTVEPTAAPTVTTQAASEEVQATAEPPATEATTKSTGNGFIYGGAALLAAVAIVWLRAKKR
ncbi:MAG: hypothetical protein GX552_14310 [Chloroflexi bacterium]|nr:hypothetical protein [Chloroflexota bacterium]